MMLPPPVVISKLISYSTSNPALVLTLTASQLSEAAQLWSQFEESAEFLSGWVDRTDPVVKSELVISDPEQIANQIDQHQVGFVKSFNARENDNKSTNYISAVQIDMTLTCTPVVW